MNELTRKATLALLLALSGLLAGRGAEPLSTLCTGTAPTISVPAAWTDGETVPGDTILALDAHSLTGDTVTVSVDGLVATFSGGGGTFRWQPWTSGTHTLTHTAGTAVWTLRVSGTQSVAGLPAGAFRDCTNLVSVTLPAGLKEIGAGAFTGCPNLARVSVPTLADWYALSFADEGANPLLTGTALYVGGMPVRLEGLRFDRLVIPEGVTRIPSEIFQNYTNLVSVTIPGSVTNIAASAFKGCRGLTSVTIPDGVASVGRGAFSGCTGLTYVKVNAAVLKQGVANVFDSSLAARVEVAESVANIVASAFSGCRRLTDVMLPASVTNIGASAFSGCSSLTGVTIPPSVTSIGTSAFSGCTGLSEVTIPPGVTNIGTSAFKGCTGLTNVVIPDGVTGIGSSAFQNCGALERIVFPAGLEQIGAGAFAGCARLARVEAPTLAAWLAVSFDDRDANPLAQGAALYLGGSASPLERLVIPDGTAHLGRYTFAGYTNLVSVTLPTSLELDEVVFGTPLSIVGGTSWNTRTDWITGVAQNYESVYQSGWVSWGSSSSSIAFKVPSGMKKIVFSWKIDLGSSSRHCLEYYLDGVRKGAYSYTTGNWYWVTDELDGSEHVLRFVCSYKGSYQGGGNYGWISFRGNPLTTFSGCSSIRSVSIHGGKVPLSVLFSDAWQSLSEVVIQPGTKGLVPGLLRGYAAVNRVVLPDGLMGIGNSAFSSCSQLTDVAIPDSVTSIGDSAFRDCAGLTEISIPSNVTSIGTSAFRDCTGLTEIVLPPSVAHIGEAAFKGCSGLAAVTIPDGVTEIGRELFSGCTGLREVVLPDGVTSIGYSAFEGCTGLTGVTIPDGVTSKFVI